MISGEFCGFLAAAALAQPFLPLCNLLIYCCWLPVFQLGDAVVLACGGVKCRGESHQLPSLPVIIFLNGWGVGALD